MNRSDVETIVVFTVIIVAIVYLITILAGQ